MDFSLPRDVERFRRDLRSWLAANLDDDVRAAGRRRSEPGAFETLRAWNRRMADAGWAAIAWPREYGGRGATALEQLVYAEETTAARAPLPVNVIGMNNIAPAIIRYGTEAQKRELLPRMMRADDVWCQGMSEPDAGSDLAALRTGAVRDGDDFVVSGRKLWTSLGHRADWCQLYVRTDPGAARHDGISCFLVDLHRPGVEARPLVTLTGDTDFAELRFDEVRVPAGNLLGPLHGGWRVATTTLGHERAGAARLYAELRTRLEDLVTDLAAADAADDADDADDAAAADGRAALEDAGVLRSLGRLAVRIDHLRILCLRSVSAELHGGDGLGSAGLAKTVWGEIGQDLAALGFDLLGARGGDGRWAEHRLAARALTIAGGTTQVTRNLTATRVLELPRR